MNAGLMVTLLVGGLGIGGTVGYLVGLDKGKVEGVQSVNITPSPTSSEVFMVKGKMYKKEELDSEFQNRLYRAQQEAYHKMEATLKEYALRIAFASEKGSVDTENIPPLEQLLPPVTVSEQKMKEFFEENKSRLPPNAKFEDFKPRLQQFLSKQESAKVFQDKFNAYEKEGTIKLVISKPIAPLVSIPIEEFPFKGNPQAKNILVEASDYLCPHCQSSYKMVKDAVKALGQDIRFVQINYSLRPDKLSGSLIQGSYCASQQGQEQFWKYHDVAFQDKWGNMNEPANSDKVVEIAKEAGLDTAKITECMKGPDAKAFVTKTNEIASSIGVTGTPTFFLNNRRFTPSHGGELVEQIRDALAQANTN